MTLMRSSGRTFVREALGEEDPRRPLRLAWDTAELAPAMARVEVGCLERDRKQHRRDAAARAAFVFGHRQHAAAEAVAPQRLRQIDEIDEQEAERGTADDAAENRAAARVLHQHTEIAPVADAGQLIIIGRQPFADHGARARRRRVRDNELIRVVVGHLGLRSLRSPYRVRAIACASAQSESLVGLVERATIHSGWTVFRRYENK